MASSSAKRSPTALTACKTRIKRKWEAKGVLNQRIAKESFDPKEQKGLFLLGVLHRISIRNYGV
jgi:hypothetical protein